MWYIVFVEDYMTISSIYSLCDLIAIAFFFIIGYHLLNTVQRYKYDFYFKLWKLMVQEDSLIHQLGVSISLNYYINDEKVKIIKFLYVIIIIIYRL